MPEYTTGVQETLPDGPVWFAVDDAGEKESKTGKAMIELQLLCYVDDPKKTVRVFDRLVFDPNSFWKIDAFRVCTGEKLVEGQKVNFEAEDCLDRKGRCFLKTTTYEGRTRNEIDQYLPPDPDQQPPSEPPQRCLSRTGHFENGDQTAIASARQIDAVDFGFRRRRWRGAQCPLQAAAFLGPERSGST